MSQRFYTLDVFTDRVFGGNPLAVFPWADGLDDTAMQSIARELNLSETVFVQPPRTERGTRAVRIFTPARELPFAGHPTVGTAFLLVAIGEVKADGDEAEIVLEERVGPVPVRVRLRGGEPTWSQLTAAVPPGFAPPTVEPDLAASLLGLEPSRVRRDTLAATVASCGTPFLFVPVVGLDDVRRARLRRDGWERHLAGTDGDMVFVFCEGGEAPDADVHGRMFAPGAGVDEDPATGSAAAALAGVLARQDLAASGTRRWIVEQGHEMGRPSRMEIEAEVAEGAVRLARVGGSSVIVSEGLLRLP